jgi:outer membrane immunogenic protein
MKSLALATALLLGISGVAIAADVAEEVVIVDEGYNWSGVYVGVQGGYQWAEDDVADPVEGNASSFDFDGALVGLHAGYDKQVGSFVFGLVGDVEWADGDGTSDAFGVGSSAFARAEVNWQASLRARIRYAFDRVLLYATGGLAVADYDFDFTCCGDPFGGGDQFSDTLVGYTVGVGAAYAFADQWNVWADYRFTDFDTASGNITNCCAPPPNSQDHDISTNAIRLGLSRRF